MKNIFKIIAWKTFSIAFTAYNYPYSNIQPWAKRNRVENFAFTFLCGLNIIK